MKDIVLFLHQYQDEASGISILIVDAQKPFSSFYSHCHLALFRHHVQLGMSYR